MYCALYRKYRPQSLDDVVGQETIVKTLKNSILNDKISHDLEDVEKQQLQKYLLKLLIVST